MHALSACTCMCLGTKPHLLQAGVLEGAYLRISAMSSAFAFLCTDTPLHERSCTHLSCICHVRLIPHAHLGYSIASLMLQNISGLWP